MMNKVKRYTHGPDQMDQYIDGDYVTYKEFQRLRRALRSIANEHPMASSLGLTRIAQQALERVGDK